MMYNCHRCDRSFGSESALAQHVADSLSHHVCTECQKDLTSAHGLHDHCRQKHPYCIECREVFGNDRELQAHLRTSLIHKNDDQPDELISCPLLHCERTFNTNSALMLHLEAGTCKSGANKAWVDRQAVLMDTHRRLFVVSGGATKLSCGFFELPLTGRGSITLPISVADLRMVLFEKSYNGAFYQCIICDETLENPRLFDAHLVSNPWHLMLNMHVDYDDCKYRCPGSRRFKGCETEFDSVSALFQHVENGNCDVDYEQFENVMDRFVKFLRDN